MCRLGSFTSSKLLGMMLCCSLIDFNSTVILTEVKTVIKTVVRISLTAYHCSSDFCLFLQKWQQSTQMYIIRVIVKRYKHTYYTKNERKKIDTRELYPNWMKSILHLIVHTHTHTRLTALYPGLPGWAGTRKVSQSGFYWRKRQWVAVASARTYASLHLAPGR